MNEESQVSAEMPKYKCHKEVWALKIAKIDNDCRVGGAMITPADEGFSKFHVDKEFMDKHKPEVGGYYVVYADGYKSYSPAKAFEEGYARIS